MKKIITQFNETGCCVVDVAEVCKRWTANYAISQFKEKFTLYKKPKGIKIEISNQQATEIIKQLSLRNVRSILFNSASTWLDIETINQQIKYLLQTEVALIRQQTELNRQLTYLHANTKYAENLQASKLQ